MTSDFDTKTNVRRNSEILEQITLGMREAGEFPVTTVALRSLLWGISLFAGIIVAGIYLYPAYLGRVILGMIAVGFCLMAVAKTSITTDKEKSADTAMSLSSPMRIVYWAGYALMASGLMLTVLAITIL